MWWYIFIGVLLWIFKKILNNENYWKNRCIPYLKTMPILGIISPTILKQRAHINVIKDAYNSFSDYRYFGTHQFLQQVLIIRDLNLINQITIKDLDHFIDHSGAIPEEVDSLLGKNIFSLKGQKWRDMRSTLSPIFTSSKMKVMFRLIAECAQDFTKYFEDQKFEKRTYEMKDIFTKFTNDAIATVAFGLKCNSLENPNNTFYLMGKQFTQRNRFNEIKFFMSALIPKVMKFLGIQIVSKDTQDYFHGIIQETIQEREASQIIRPDLIHLLIEARKGRLVDDESGDGINRNSDKTVKANLSDMDITAQAFVFFLAGFETSSTLMSLVAYCIAVHPEVQSKLLAEIDEVNAKCEEGLTYETLMQMKYLDMVISETLRLWPLGYVLDRLCVKDYVIPAKNPNEVPCEIKKGQSIMIPVYGIHHDPQYYPNPEKFDPERFSPENKHNLNSRAYFPFGIGPRSCIASRLALLEAKLLFFYMLSKFEFEVTSETMIPLKMLPSIQLAPEKGFLLNLRRRTV